MRAIDADTLITQIVTTTEEAFMNASWKQGMTYALGLVETQPTIQPEPHEIGYDDCANALLKMWMDNVLTDGEYYRIADKLNKKWSKVERTEPYKGVTE